MKFVIERILEQRSWDVVIMEDYSDEDKNPDWAGYYKPDRQKPYWLSDEDGEEVRRLQKVIADSEDRIQKVLERRGKHPLSEE